MSSDPTRCWSERLRGPARLAAGVWIAGLIATSLAASALEIEFVPIRNAGNPPDDTGRGSVSYDYEIAKYETTNAQYVEFLNSVANEMDLYGLYNQEMAGKGISFPPVPVGFERYYEVEPGFANKPVRLVSFWDAVRFANWLHNGQPIGLQGPTTTESGAYVLDHGDVAQNQVVREPTAQYFVTSENEWYKAAYYDPSLPGYYDYPAGTDVEIVCTVVSTFANRANCAGAIGQPTDVGSYAGSPSPYGTFDQGGNLREWVETISGAARQVRGGAWFSPESDVSSLGFTGYTADFDLDSVGFRVARTLPEPDQALLTGVAMLVLATLGRR